VAPIRKYAIRGARRGTCGPAAIGRLVIKHDTTLSVPALALGALLAYGHYRADTRRLLADAESP
jgi:hypothetical protein